MTHAIQPPDATGQQCREPTPQRVQAERRAARAPGFDCPSGEIGATRSERGRRHRRRAELAASEEQPRPAGVQEEVARQQSGVSACLLGLVPALEVVDGRCRHRGNVRVQKRPHDRKHLPRRLEPRFLQTCIPARLGRAARQTADSGGDEHCSGGLGQCQSGHAGSFCPGRRAMPSVKRLIDCGCRVQT